jgi:hypothetical protein
MEIKKKDINEIKSIDNENPIFETQEDFNQSYIDDLLKTLKTNSTVPSYVPKKFIDCIYLYFDGATDYRLYVYINNTWKYVTLS